MKTEIEVQVNPKVNAQIKQNKHGKQNRRYEQYKF